MAEAGALTWTVIPSTSVMLPEGLVIVHVIEQVPALSAFNQYPLVPLITVAMVGSELWNAIVHSPVILFPFPPG